MSQPPAYTRSFSYTGWSADHPTTPQPGVSLDNDFNGISATLKAVLANLALIQRDDGKLANGAVGLDTLDSATLLAFGAGGSWKPRGAWLTATAYGIGDVVAQGTGTYVAAVAHTSGTFATDAAAGKWIKIFDAAGSIPADGSVTAPKLANGAVTTPAIGFTALDLAGTLRGAGGLSAGTAPLGSLLHAKLDTGDVLVKSERKTDAQGVVGYRWIGVSVSWDAVIGANGSDLSILRNGTQICAFTPWGAYTSGTLLAMGAAPPAGDGASLSYSGLTGVLRAYNADTNTWRALKVQGATITMTAAGVDLASFDNVYGLTITKSVDATYNPITTASLRARMGASGEAATIQFTNVNTSVQLGRVLHDGTNLHILSDVGQVKINNKLALTQAESNVAGTGHLMLNNGLILNWGSLGVVGGGSFPSYAFDKPFSSAVLAVVLTKQTASAVNDPINLYSTSLTGFTAANGGTTSTGGYYLALGI